jgi:SnoaL-like domain
MTPDRRLIDAFLAGDHAAAATLLPPGARFHSPIRDYEGAEQIAAVWGAVAGVIRDARVTSVHERDDDTAAFFAGEIEGRAVDGVLRVHGADITLMVRPWAALKAGLANVSLSPAAAGTS